MCSDLTTHQADGSDDCAKPCTNGGICFQGTCECPKGYYGDQCEKQAQTEDDYASNESDQQQTATTETTKRKKKTGINYLLHTTETEKPPELVAKLKGETSADGSTSGGDGSGSGSGSSDNGETSAEEAFGSSKPLQFHETEH